MKPVQKKALAAAVVAALGVGSAEAVYQNPNGTGQVLIYPYFTVQQVGGKSMNTLVTVVNTTTTAKVMKVRFREGKASKEVLDFNLYLSPNDVWTAAIVPGDASESSPGRLLSFDKSCTNPAIPATGVDFRNFEYAGDGLGNGLDRTREGYLEILELATLTGAAKTAVTHNAAGLPANCAYVRTANGAVPDPNNNVSLPTGGLTGTGTIINVAQGSDIGYNAVALSNWRYAPLTASLSSETNNLSDGDPTSLANQNYSYDGAEVSEAVASIFLNRAGAAGALNPIDAVSSTMMATSVINEFVLDGATKSNTDWVFTFPTRHFYHGRVARSSTASSNTVNPFSEKFTAFGLCEPIQVTYFNREEASAVAAGSDFSPAPEQEVSALCFESTILSFRSGQAHHPSGLTSAVLGSKNITPVTVGNFENGWASVSFLGEEAYIEATGSIYITANADFGISGGSGANTFAGLPVVGFMARSLTNTTAGTCDVVPCNYNSSFGHKFTTSSRSVN